VASFPPAQQLRACPRGGFVCEGLRCDTDRAVLFLGMMDMGQGEIVE
jgi:hypothetical protein